MTEPERSHSLRTCSHCVRHACNHRPLLNLAANELSSGRNAGVASGGVQFLGAFGVESSAEEASDFPGVRRISTAWARWPGSRRLRRPSWRPRARAACSPPRVHSRMSARSNFAKALGRLASGPLERIALQVERLVVVGDADVADEHRVVSRNAQETVSTA